MLLTVVAHAPLSPLCEQWADAIAPMRILHPNRESLVLVKLVDEAAPLLVLSLDWTRDTQDGRRRERFQISSVRLTYFPGAREAREWLTAGWCGYLMHEAMEMVIADGAMVFDPHTDPYETAPMNWPLRDGLPTELTPETLKRAMRVVGL